MGWAFASGRGAKGDPNWSYDTHGGGVAVPTTTVEEKRRIDKLVGDELERRAALQKEKTEQTRRELLLEVDAAKQRAEATLATMAREHEEALFVLEERHKTHMGECAARWDGERQEMRKAMDRLGGEHQLRHNETTSEFHDWQRETDREKSLEQRMHEQTVASLKSRLMGLDQAVAEGEVRYRRLNAEYVNENKRRMTVVENLHRRGGVWAREIHRFGNTSMDNC